MNNLDKQQGEVKPFFVALDYLKPVIELETDNKGHLKELNDILITYQNRAINTLDHGQDLVLLKIQGMQKKIKALLDKQKLKEQSDKVDRILTLVKNTINTLAKEGTQEYIMQLNTCDTMLNKLLVKTFPVHVKQIKKAQDLQEEVSKRLDKK